MLLFDEPTAALDPEITAQIVSIIRELAQTQITQVIVTHEVEVARKTASRVVYMENGRIIEQGDASHFTAANRGVCSLSFALSQDASNEKVVLAALLASLSLSASAAQTLRSRPRRLIRRLNLSTPTTKSGFDVDLANALCKEIDATCTFTNRPSTA